VSFRTARVRGVAAAAAVATATLLVTAQAGDALADANGCTSAPGYTGALNCVGILGSGLQVDSAQSRYQPGVSPWPQQLCNRVHLFQFRRYGYATSDTKKLVANGCIFGLLPDYLDWANPGRMSDGSSFCARSSNSQTGYTLTPYACKTITY